LRDISLVKNYAAICGITETELVDNFKPEIEAMADEDGCGFDDMLGQLRKNYNGYHFSDDVKKENSVYNPFSVLNSLSNRSCGYYWFSTGTPTFLVRKLEAENFEIPNLSMGVNSSPQAISDYRPENDDPVPLLFQSGYLTIKRYDKTFGEFTLAYPNNEVKYGFLNALLPVYMKRTLDFRGLFVVNFVKDLFKGDIEAFMNRMTAFFAGISGGIDRDHEHYVQSIFYVVFTLMGEFTRTEVKSAKGRADMVVETKDAVYCFEFKVSGNGTVEAALKQIDEKGYLVPFSAEGKRPVKIGAVFDEAKGTLGEWKIV
jgi:hypothetical protein